MEKEQLAFGDRGKYENTAIDQKDKKAQEHSITSQFIPAVSLLKAVAEQDRRKL